MAYQPPSIAECILDVLTTHERWIDTPLLIHMVLDLHPEWRRDSIYQAIRRLTARNIIERRDLKGHPEYHADRRSWDYL